MRPLRASVCLFPTLRGFLHSCYHLSGRRGPFPPTGPSAPVLRLLGTSSRPLPRPRDLCLDLPGSVGRDLFLRLSGAYAFLLVLPGRGVLLPFPPVSSLSLVHSPDAGTLALRRLSGEVSTSLPFLDGVPTCSPPAPHPSLNLSPPTLTFRGSPPLLVKEVLVFRTSKVTWTGPHP